MNHMERLRSMENGIANQPLIEGGQLSLVRAGERKQITVGHLGRIQKAITIHSLRIEQRDVVGPELVAGQCAELF